MASRPLIAPGARVGKYEVVHRIACGGMAEIYLARASGIYGFEKYVVLKRILPQYAANEEFVRMFLKEARVAASLDHANIAHVHDIGETADGAFFTMEYLHGEDLRHVMRQVLRSHQRLPLEHALAIVIGAASGLHFAHEKRGPDGRSLGIVHRDVSPANIVVTYDGGVKVVDFGIAKLAADPELSQRYALKGKLPYMSPEQIHNHSLDRRSDVFSLGIVLYEVTTHERLFKRATEVETMQAVLEGVIPMPTAVLSDYPRGLERIVLRALSPAPGNRYQSARELQVDLEAFVHEERIRLSAATLAEWMERTFGAKRELWHTLQSSDRASARVTAPPSALPEPLPTAAEPGMTTKVIAPAHVESRPHPSAAPAPELHRLDPQRRLGWRGLVGALAVVTAAGAFWHFRADVGRLPLPESAMGDAPDSRERLRSESPGVLADSSAKRAASSVLLVAERGQIALEGGPVAAVPPAAAGPGPGLAQLPSALGTRAPGATAAPAGPTGTTALAAVTPLSPTPATSAAKRPRRRAESGASRNGSFSATFARREGDIRRCFLEHSGGASSNEISLRFDVGRDGRVAAIAVQPAALAAGPLGKCLAAVGQSTVFQKQSAPVTFRIPLTVETGNHGGR